MKRGRVSGDVVVRPLGRNDWPAIEALFGAKGACGGCWCMYWRVPRGGKDWEEAKGEKNRSDLRRLVKAGEVHAVLALAGGVPVGWCSFGPRVSFPRLSRVRALQREGPVDTWSVVCFYILPDWRRQGLAKRLLTAATERAFELGAREVEGYPVVPWDEATPLPGAFAWTGVAPVFEAVGYAALDRPKVSRPLYVKRRPEPG